ncbi:MAG TPA: ATP-binding cassette domain-containing protein [Methanospirillum sp.]|nr:ATP-binding cassette domain-containing protein [Methanospirillum sp.]
MEFAGVSKSYRAGIGGATRSVLSDCTSTIGAGESVGLMGASGSGKSTLGRILAGLERPDHGVIRFCGEDIYAGTRTSWKRFRRSVQMLFQDPGGAFHPMRRIDQSLKQVLELYGDSAANHDDTIRAMLFRVGLHGEVLFRYPDQISGGQAQRLALARLLLVHPRVIILDEPTSGLDISVQAQILHLLKDVQRTCCVSYFLISHDEEVIRFMTDRFYILTEGTLMSSE